MFDTMTVTKAGGALCGASCKATTLLATKGAGGCAKLASVELNKLWRAWHKGEGGASVHVRGERAASKSAGLVYTCANAKLLASLWGGSELPRR